jgi:HKD family nuclease
MEIAGKIYELKGIFLPCGKMSSSHIFNQPFDGCFVDKLKDLINKEDFKSLQIVVAYASSRGIEYVDEISKIIGKDKISIAVGIHDCRTSRQALRKLLDEGIDTYVVHDSRKSHIFHPKIYLLKSASKALVSIGSSNLTDGGLRNNYEMNFLHLYDLEDKIQRNEVESFAGLMNKQYFSQSSWVTKLDQKLYYELLRKRRLGDEITESRRWKQGSPDDIFGPGEGVFKPKAPQGFEKIEKPKASIDQHLLRIFKKHCPEERMKTRLKWERKARQIISDNLGTLNRRKLRDFISFINTDSYEERVRYDRFVGMFLMSNTNRILNNNMKRVNEYVIDVFHNENITDVESYTSKLPGIKDGFTSTLLYLKDNRRYDVYSPRKLEGGLRKIFKIQDKLRGTFEERYLFYNELVKKLRTKHNFPAQAMDIILVCAYYDL